MKKKFEWDDHCQKAFQELKEHLEKPPVLSSPVEGEILYLYMAVSEHAVSSVLIREEQKV